MIRVAGDRFVSPSPLVRLEPLPEVAALRPIDVAEAFRDLPGLALLESARPGRNARWTYLAADPVAVLSEPARGGDPFAVARRLLARLAPGAPAGNVGWQAGPPFRGGLVGFLAYELADALERLPPPPADDQELASLRLALHDWAIAWDRRTGSAWLAGRALDGDAARLGRRLAEVRERVRPSRLERAAVRAAERAAADEGDAGELVFTSSLDRPAYEAGVEAVRAAIARGDIYQANLTRRLATAFDGDPWLLYRRLRTGDPSLFSAYLDLGGGAPGHSSALGSAPARPRAILSASPEPFLAVSRAGVVSTDPIKGTRPRGRTRDEDRALARELLASAKDRAENVMIVDLVRNDLGVVAVTGSVEVPALCVVEQHPGLVHLVSTVRARLRDGAGWPELIAASFPPGSVTGAPKSSALAAIAALEPVQRGPYCGAVGWVDADRKEAVLAVGIRTFWAAQGQLHLGVGAGIVWGSDPSREWAETELKAHRLLAAAAEASQ